VGKYELGTRFWLLDTGYWILDTGYWNNLCLVKEKSLKFDNSLMDIE
jgi:hypothetical protein